MPTDEERVGRELSPRERFLVLGWVVAGLLAVGGYMYVDHLHTQLAEARVYRLENTNIESAAERLVRQAIDRAQREQARSAGSGATPDENTNEAENEEQIGEDDGE